MNKIFWTLQIIGWGIPSTLNTWGKLSSNTGINDKYIILEGLVFFVSGIICSTLFRHYLKHNISFIKFRKADVIKLIFGLLVFATVFTLLMLSLVAVYNLLNDSAYELSQFIIFVSFLNILTFLFFWLALYLLIKITVRMRLERVESLQLQAELKESQLNTLKGQLNPHFLFNSLNNIRGLMLEDVYKARDMITRLSEILRYSLNKDNIDTISISEELQMVDNYIALSKIQFEERLQYDSEVKETLLNNKIPPMVIQMLIENAVKHGIANQHKGGLVTLKITENDKTLQIQVTNTGQLLKPGGTTKVGLKNIEKRLKLLYQDNASFSLSQQDNEVFAMIKLPLS